MATPDAKFTSGSLMRHVSVMSFTASLGMLAIFAVDFVDMIFISMLGNDALAAAIGYAGTVLFFTTSISIGLSIAAGALVAQAIGAGEGKDTREYATSVLMIGLIMAIAVVAIVFTWQDQLLTLLGATGEVKTLARSYLSIILPSMPILMGAMVFGAVLRAHGDAKRAMYTTLLGGIVNAVLDPLFIFGFGWGLEGAALASVAARCAIFLAAIIPVIRVYNGLARPKAEFLIRDFKAVSGIAGPAILANVATPVGSAIVVREMAKFGTDAVAGMAVIGRLTPVAFAVVFALSGAIGPIVGQNFGAGLNARVREGFFAALKFATVYVILVSALLFLLRPQIAGIFNAEGEALDLIYLFCGPLALMWIFNGWIFVGNASFNNLHHPFYSTWINWGRSTIGTWPPVLLCASIWGAGGVLIGQALGGVVFAFISIWLALRIMEKAPAPVAGDAFSREQRLHVVTSRRH